MLVDTEGPVLKAKVHVANVVDQEGIKELLEHANESFPRLKHLWLDAGYRGEEKGKGWVEKVQPGHEPADCFTVTVGPRGAASASGSWSGTVTPL